MLSTPIIIQTHIREEFIFILLTPSERNGSQSFGLTTDVEDSKNLYQKFDFLALTVNDLTRLINQIINGVSEKLVPDVI